MQVVGIAHSPRYAPRVIEWLRKNVRPGQTIGIEAHKSDIAEFRRTTKRQLRTKGGDFKFWRRIVNFCDKQGINVVGFAPLVPRRFDRAYVYEEGFWRLRRNIRRLIDFKKRFGSERTLEKLMQQLTQLLEKAVAAKAKGNRSLQARLAAEVRSLDKLTKFIRQLPAKSKPSWVIPGFTVQIVNMDVKGLEGLLRQWRAKLLPSARERRLDEAHMIVLQERFFGRGLAFQRPDFVLGGAIHAKALAHRLRSVYGVPAKPLLLTKVPAKEATDASQLRKLYGQRLRRRGIDLKRVEATRLERLRRHPPRRLLG